MIVIATPGLWDRGEAIQGNVGRLRLLGRRVGALLAMTIPAD
jgi:hypothetical protein